MKKDITIKHNKLTKWNWMVQYPEGLVLPNSVDIGAFCYINAQYGVLFGEKVEIGSHSSIYSNSTIDGKHGRVVIGENAKIGTHSTVMPGVTIGKNVTIGAYSFVNKNIPDGVLAYGCPAKVVNNDQQSNR